jgi:RNA polymerase sigma factor (sigma-70 family)
MGAPAPYRAYVRRDGPWASTDFDAFFQVAYPEAYRLATGMGLGSHDAEDVALESLTRTFVSWSRLGTASWKRAWLTRVVANLVIDVHRRRRRPPSAESEATGDPQSAVRVDLSRAIAKLPRRQRQVAVLRYLADLSVADVGDVLRMRPGTVKQHATRAVRALRAELGDRYEGG